MTCHPSSRALVEASAGVSPLTRCPPQLTPRVPRSMADLRALRPQGIAGLAMTQAPMPVKVFPPIISQQARTAGGRDPCRHARPCKSAQHGSGRPAVGCRFLPLGSMFQPSTSEEPETLAPPLQHSFDLLDPQPFNPFSVFVAMAYHTGSSQPGWSLDKVHSLWRQLSLIEKAGVYQALDPFCDQLNSERDRQRLQGLWAKLAEDMSVMLPNQLFKCTQLEPSSTPPHSTSTQAQQSISKSLAAAEPRILEDEACVASVYSTLETVGLVTRESLQAQRAQPTDVLGTSDVRLVTTIRPSTQQEFGWGGFMTKCRLAWDVFFPPVQTLTPAGAMRARLKMVLVSDRSGLDLPTLLKIRNESLTALAKAEGWDNLSELELQVASSRGDGEQVLALPLSQMPSPFMLRNAEEYDYEYYDDDDYSEDDDPGVADLCDGLPAPKAPQEVLTEGRTTLG